ncbi:MAG: FAD-dependent oxidoreductase, partial [Desulfomicrobium escambiense]|nr:FAD-dependent oxidoreductase [Desulfomicrobium escambiense]
KLRIAKVKQTTTNGIDSTGCEAAWRLARAGVRVDLFEMRPQRMTPAHHSDGLGELVCSNSLRSDDAATTRSGLLKEELRRLGSPDHAPRPTRPQVPAGGALAVDRDGFAAGGDRRARRVTRCIDRCAARRSLRPAGRARPVIVATGPLTADAAGRTRSQALTGEEHALLLRRHRADRRTPTPSTCRRGSSARSRYGKGDGRRLPQLSRSTATQYHAFVAALLAGREGGARTTSRRHALLRGLPADRGDGRARPRDPGATGR